MENKIFIICQYRGETLNYFLEYEAQAIFLEALRNSLGISRSLLIKFADLGRDSKVSPQKWRTPDTFFWLV